jgi:hypothetical protein
MVYAGSWLLILSLRGRYNRSCLVESGPVLEYYAAVVGLTMLAQSRSIID